MADGSPMPNWVFRAFDYLGLGCILICPAEFIVRPNIWQIWAGTLFTGCVFLWFGEKAPKLKVKLLARWRASKDLAAALTENADLKKQLIEQTNRASPDTETLVVGPASFEEQRKTQLAGLLSPLQIEALSLAKELRDFNAACPFPDLPDPDFEMERESLRRLIDTRATEQQKWRQKLLHGYANRGFGPRITALMHRLGEKFEYPANVANYAEDLRVPMKDTIPKLAQQMEMAAIWINRKQRNEVDLFHSKS